MILEYEAALCDEGKMLSTCPLCGIKTFRESCPNCGGSNPVSLTGDALADDLFARLERGEDVDMEELRGDKREQQEDTFETLTPGSNTCPA